MPNILYSFQWIGNRTRLHGSPLTYTSRLILYSQRSCSYYKNNQWSQLVNHAFLHLQRLTLQPQRHRSTICLQLCLKANLKTATVRLVWLLMFHIKALFYFQTYHDKQQHAILQLFSRYTRVSRYSHKREIYYRFLWAGCPSCHSTCNVKALQETQTHQVPN